MQSAPEYQQPTGHKAMTTVVEQLAAWSSKLKFADIPDAVLHAAERCLIDIVGVICLGSTTSVAARAHQYLDANYKTANSQVAGHPLRFTAEAAAFANATAAHACDYDDTSYAGVLHPTAAVFPAALACAQQQVDTSGKTLLLSFIAGMEIIGALGKGFSNNLYHRGWFNSGLLGAIGAAAASARILNLTLKQTHHALSLAAAQSASSRAVLGTEAKPLVLARASQLGVHAAQLASFGVDAPLNVFEHHNGLVELMNNGQFDQAAPHQLGTTWSLLDPGIAFKRYPLCSAAQAGAEAAHQLQLKHAISVRDIQHICCEATELVLMSLPYSQPTSISQAQFSMPFAIACALVHGEINWDHLSGETWLHQEIHDLMAKVTLLESAELRADPDTPQLFPEGAIVEILLNDAQKFRERLGAATGMPNNPMSLEQLMTKFKQCMVLTTSPQQIEERLECLQNLAKQKNCNNFLD